MGVGIKFSLLPFLFLGVASGAMLGSCILKISLVQEVYIMGYISLGWVVLAEVVPATDDTHCQVHTPEVF